MTVPTAPAVLASILAIQRRRDSFRQPLNKEPVHARVERRYFMKNPPICRFLFSVFTAGLADAHAQIVNGGFEEDPYNAAGRGPSG